MCRNVDEPGGPDAATHRLIAEVVAHALQAVLDAALAAFSCAACAHHSINFCVVK